jgi:uncharacterized protein (TIGR02452 family)
MRAKQAKHVINKVVPAILASNARARRGAEGSELIVDPGPVKLGTLNVPQGGKKQEKEKDPNAAYVRRRGQGRRKMKGAEVNEEGVVDGQEFGNRKGKNAKRSKRKVSLEEEFEDLTVSPVQLQTQHQEVRRKRRVRIITTDSLTAAHMLTFPSQYASDSGHDRSQKGHKNRDARNVCVLNMASPLRPGGGVLSGATSQEEFLCARTTLLPSLQESFYRLPEIGGIYTQDVHVFRNSSPLGDASGELGPGDRYWIDVISAGMLRFPELEGGEGEEKRLSKGDRDIVERKMRGVLRILAAKGIKRAILGAWGCGAYGNPVADIARAWKAVLVNVQSTGLKSGAKKNIEEAWEDLEEVVFAIPNPRMASDFAKAYGGVAVEDGPGRGEEEEEDSQEDEVARELETKIEEMEGQIAQVWNPDLKVRLGAILEGLRAQLAERVGPSLDEADDESNMEDPSEDEEAVSDELDLEKENDSGEDWSDDFVESETEVEHART